MANKRNFTFLKSNYTLRTKHKTLNKKDSAIYVRDFMVTTNNGGWDSGSIPYGESNFKMVNRYDEKHGRKHAYGKWLSNGESDVWTLEEIKNGLSQYESIRDINKQSVMNTNYKSLLDFAYFGNCTELIKSSVTDIINKFPGELHVTNHTYTYYDEKLDDMITIKGDASNGHPTEVPLYYIDNPFGIDIFTPSIAPSTENKIKYLCVSRNSYKILNKYESACGIDMQRWIVEFEPNVNLNCLKDGQFVAKVLLLGKYDGNKIEYHIDFKCEGGLVSDATFIIYVYFQDGKFIYLTDTVWSDYHIRLSDEKIEEFYQTQLDDFQRFLLNRETKPRYLIEIDTLTETDEGFKTGTVKLNWPTVSGGWNLDVESTKYELYLEKLLAQAEIYDEYYSNNLWRMMTHDSIKNMDLTFDNEKLDEDVSDYNIGTTKVEGLFWAYGREFDDLKRYIDNIKHTNSISLGDNGTIAENALYEKCSSSGWELYNPVQSLNYATEVKQLFQNQFKTYTLSDVKDRFFKELFLNSKNIFSRKGTKYAIEMLMSLFGFCSYEYGKSSYKFLSPQEQVYGKTKWEELNDGEKQLYYDYKIDEFVAVATNKATDIVDNSEDLPCETYNALKTGFAPRNEFYEDADPLEGLPVRAVEFINGNGDIKKYIIPWYDKLQYNSNRMYFQMYGGWGKISLKDIDETIHISPTTEAQHFSELRSTEDFKIYSETLKYIKVKENVQELLRTDYTELIEGDVYYINSPLVGEYHYYVLSNKEKSGSLEGWTAVTEEDFTNKTKNALNVIYLETIIDDYRANNPHVGYGKYDDGNEYLEYFRHLFKYEIDNDSVDNPSFNSSAYDCNTGGVFNEIYNCGFTIGDIVRDNVKTWYFVPSNLTYKMEMTNRTISKFPGNISSNMTLSVVEDSKKIKNMDTLCVSFSNQETTEYKSVFSIYDQDKIEFDKKYTISFWIKNSDKSSIRVKAKLGYVPGVTLFSDKDTENQGKAPYEYIVIAPNEERYIEFTGYPFYNQWLQLFVQPEDKDTNTGKYYRIEYYITQVYLRQINHIESLYKDTITGNYYIGDLEETNDFKIGAMANEYMHYESDLLPFNLETQEAYSNDEAAANSIINVKNLTITFANKYTNFEGFRTYLYGSIMPYVTQLIPSSTILNVEFEGVESSDVVMYDIVQGVGII